MNKWIYRVGIMLCVIAAGLQAADDHSRQPRQRTAGGHNERDERLEQMRREARGVAGEIEGTLKELLAVVNKNERPEKPQIDAAATLLNQSKRYGPAFEDRDKAKFMLLQSWTYFFQDNMRQALNWSMRACKTYEPAQDPWITQALFSMLNDKRPMKPRPPRPQRPARNDQMAMIMPQTRAYSEQGTLDFDFMEIHDDQLDMRFNRLELPTISGNTVNYTPGQDTVCIFFHQSDEEQVPADANVPGQTRPQIMPGQLMQEMPGLLGQQQTVTDAAQFDYFQMLANACKVRDTMKFIQVGEGEDTPDLQAEEVTIPAVSADLALFKDIDKQKPFMMIVDAEGKTKYAGTASGFVPAFILTETTGIEIDLGRQQSGPQLMQPGERMLDMELMMPEMMMRPVKPREVKADPNKPAVDPNSVAAPPKKKTRPSHPDFPTQKLEDEVRAEKLLQLAEIEIGKSLKLRNNPVKGIEACRKVLTEFPNTQYAQQAREWLRKIPERYQKMNNITKEELGY